jgi:hypothetical protein
MEAIRQPFHGLTLVAAHRGVQVVIAADPCAAVAQRCGLKWDPVAWRQMDILELDVEVSREGVPVVVDHVTEEIKANAPRNRTTQSLELDPVRLLEGIDCDVEELSLWAAPESPPLLDDVLEHVKLARMRLVLCLNTLDPPATRAAWEVVARKSDHNGVPFHRSVLFKTAARNYPRPGDFRASFSTRRAAAGAADWNFMNLMLRYDVAEGWRDCGSRLPDTGSLLVESLGACAAGGMPFVVGAEVRLKHRGGVLRNLIMTPDLRVRDSEGDLPPGNVRCGLQAGYGIDALIHESSTAEQTRRRFQCSYLVYCATVSVNTTNLARLIETLEAAVTYGAAPRDTARNPRRGRATPRPGPGRRPYNP